MAVQQNTTGLKINLNSSAKKKAKGQPLKLSIGLLSQKSKLNDKQKEFFYIELYSMLEAGIDIKRSLDIFTHQQKKETEKQIFIQLQTNLIKGQSLSESMKEVNVFSPYEYYCIQIGEESGQLLKVLKELSAFYSSKLKIKKQLIKSLSYPAVIMLASIGAVSFMMAFIVPMFSDIFKRFNGELPYLTKFFINVSNGISNNFYLIVTFLLTLIVGLVFALKNKKVIQKLQFFYLKVPFLGALISGVYFARFFSSLALLLGARVPLVRAIQLVTKMIEFYPLQVALKNVESDILNGKTFYGSLTEQKIFDAKVLAMIRIGEDINKLPDFFTKLNNRYMDEVEIKSAALNTFLEPFIIMTLGLIIGLILISMYLPMFRLSSSMGM